MSVLSYRASIILPHITGRWQRANKIAKHTPELNVQEVASEINWRLVGEYVEVRKVRDSSTRWHTVKEFRLKGSVEIE